MKKCPECQKVKEYSEFYKNRTTKDGFHGYCKNCSRIFARRYHKANKEKVNERVRRYYEANSKKIIERTSKWNKANLEKMVGYSGNWQRNNPEKFEAKDAVKCAIKLGGLVRGKCEVCGAIKTGGHHDSYKEEDWLKVRWLCPRHHSQFHREFNKINKYVITSTTIK